MASSTIDNLAIIRKILTESLDIICDNLDPNSDFLRKLKSKGAIEDNDAAYVNNKITSGDKAEELLSILKKKKATSYEIFKETLSAKGREDLLEQIKNLEMKHGYVAPKQDKPKVDTAVADSSFDSDDEFDLTPSAISDVIGELTSDELLLVYERLDISYRKVAKAHEKANTTDPDEKAKWVFRGWQEKKGRTANKKAILEALEEAELMNTKEILQKKWRISQS